MKKLFIFAVLIAFVLGAEYARGTRAQVSALVDAHAASIGKYNY